jgi:thymidylate synthase
MENSQALETNNNSKEKKQNVSDEQQYLEILQNILQNGEKRIERTGIGTLSLFGTNMRFDISDFKLPLLTTKKMFWKAIVEELLWMLRGETDSKILEEKNVNIWKGNSSREFLDKNGFFYREEGDIGPGYGFQWRHFGENYVNCKFNKQAQGFDQIIELLKGLKENPTSRRHILTAWNPSQSREMCLPPCHMMAQFYVSNDNKLSCQMYQRSGDFGLGIPFNIASYSLLTHLIAHQLNLKTGEFVHIVGDSHIYLNHVEPLKEQIKRKPFPFPILQILKKEKIYGIIFLKIFSSKIIRVILVSICKWLFKRKK